VGSKPAQVRTSRSRRGGCGRQHSKSVSRCVATERKAESADEIENKPRQEVSHDRPKRGRPLLTYDEKREREVAALRKDKAETRCLVKRRYVDLMHRETKFPPAALKRPGKNRFEIFFGNYQLF
jgi:hypothetical protein